MASSENPFRSAFWLGDTDARPPALLRMALGALAAADILDRLRDFHAFYAPGGILPGFGEGLRGSLHWSLFALAPSRAGTLALFAVGFAVAVAFALGYQARVAGVLLWVFELSLQNRNPLVCDGGDAVLQALLFWCMFTDTGAVMSLDVRLGRRAAQATVAAIGVRLLQLQVAFIYAVTFLAKSGPTWRDGTAVLRALTGGDWGRGLAPLVAAHPRLCAALSWGTLIVEGTFPLLVWSPFRPRLTRGVAIVGGLILHTGIFLTMRIGMFSQVMPASYLILLHPAWLDRVSAWWGWRRAEPRPAPRRPASGMARLTAALLLGQFGLIALDQVLQARRLSTPRPIAVELALTGQHQNWRMFAPDAPLAEVTWRAPALTGLGVRDLVKYAIPQLGEHRGFWYSRWHRVRNTLPLKPPGLLLPLGRYVCRRWAVMHPETPLLRFDLIARVRPTLSQAPGEEKVIFHQACQSVAP